MSGRFPLHVKCVSPCPQSYLRCLLRLELASSVALSLSIAWLATAQSGQSTLRWHTGRRRPAHDIAAGQAQAQ